MTKENSQHGQKPPDLSDNLSLCNLNENRHTVINTET